MNIKRPVFFVLETGSLAGGVRVVGELANRLVGRGWPVTIFSVNPIETMKWFHLSPNVKWISFLKDGTTDDYNQLSVVLKKQSGFKIATFWRTAFVVSESAKEGEGLYLVQDIETSYTSQPIVADVVMETYQLPLRKFTTSRWVEKKLGCDYIGIGLNDFYGPVQNAKKNGFALACIRRQALKGYSETLETIRYLNANNRRVITFGIDPSLPIAPTNRHVVQPPDKEVRQMYNECAVFFSASRHEGFSLTPLEAMACGCPVVMTDADGNMEYAEDDKNCLIASGPEDLAEKALYCLTDRALALSLSTAGAETAKRYRWNEVLHRMEQILST